MVYKKLKCGPASESIVVGIYNIQSHAGAKCAQTDVKKVCMYSPMFVWTLEPRLALMCMRRISVFTQSAPHGKL